MPLPIPVPGLVISYAFLWRHEHDAGIREGRKDRPCAVVVATRDERTGETRVIVAPITHCAPDDPEGAIEIPPKVKAHLGLDGERSWVVLSDLNRFSWPGFDIRPIPGQAGRFDYGMLPPRFFETIRRGILALDRRRVTNR